MRKTAIVTGASRGIGRAVALALAEDYTDMIISCAHNGGMLEEVRGLAAQKGCNCLTFVGNMGSYGDVSDMFDLARQHFDHVDILVNNAGVSIVGLFQDMSADEWRSLFSSNVDSVFNCCHFAVEDMLARHSGKIINISSVWGAYGASCEAAYSATKGAVNAFTRALAKELAPSNIQVNAVACGAIDTDMNSHLSADERRQLENEIPSGRFGKPEEVAELVRYLANANSYLTGQVIALDGAWL